MGMIFREIHHLTSLILTMASLNQVEIAYSIYKAPYVILTKYTSLKPATKTRMAIHLIQIANHQLTTNHLSSSKEKQQRGYFLTA